MTPPRRQSPLLTAAHGFFGREGGISQGSYTSLNGSFSSGDAEEAVAENRRRMAEALGAEVIVTARQTHSPDVLVIDAPFAFEARPEADALITRRPGLAVGVLTADCVPVLFEAEGIVAAAHAGWRGSLGGVLGNTVRQMTAYGANPGHIRAAIGPCLRKESFEVRSDLVEQVLSRHPDAERHFVPLNERQCLYDHVGFIRDRLIEAGIVAANIDDVGGDTLSEGERFFSFRGAQRRKQDKFGHNLSAISLI